MDNWDKYFIEETTVLKNKFNIKDEKMLNEKEKEITFEKIIKLSIKPIEGSFNSQHLKAIHKYIFNDIYDFAGEYRSCTMAKKTQFRDPEVLEDDLNNALRKLNNEVKNVISV